MTRERRVTSEDFYFLYLPLSAYWFDLIATGKKKIEFRECKDYWTKRIRKAQFSNKPIKIVFTRGYTKRKLIADVTAISVIYGINTDLHINKNVYAIAFENVCVLHKKKEGI